MNPVVVKVKKGCGQRKSRRDAEGRARHAALVAQAQRPKQ